MTTNDKRTAVRPLATLFVAFLLAIVAFAATGGTSTGNGDEIFLSVTPEFATNDVGSDHTVMATVTYDGLPTEGFHVAFFVIAGPNVDVVHRGYTDDEG